MGSPDGHRCDQHLSSNAYFSHKHSSGKAYFSHKHSSRDKGADQASMANANASWTYSVTDDSSGSDGEADAQRQFSLSDARFALSYVKCKMEKQDIMFDDDDSGRILAALKKHHRRSSSSNSILSSSETSSSSGSSRTYSSFSRPERKVVRRNSSSRSFLSSSQTSSSSGSSRTYSSFSRPENKRVSHKMELLQKDDDDAFNIYSSDVDFIEHPVSISMIEDTPVRQVQVLSANDCNGNALRSTLRSSRAMYPLLPPRKPPPLQRGPAAQQTLRSHRSDDDLSHAILMKKGRIRLLTVVDFDNSDSYFSLLGRIKYK